MRKIIIALVVLVAVFIGGSYYFSGLVSERYEAFESLNSKNLSIKSEQTRGIFSTKNKSEITIKKEMFSDILGLSEEENDFEDISFEIDSTTSNSLFSAISGLETTGSVKLVSHKDIAKNLFGGDEIATFKTIVSGKNTTTNIKTNELNFVLNNSDEDVKASLKPVKITVKLNENQDLTYADYSVESATFHGKDKDGTEAEFAIENYFESLEYNNPLKIGAINDFKSYIKSAIKDMDIKDVVELKKLKIAIKDAQDDTKIDLGDIKIYSLSKNVDENLSIAMKLDINDIYLLSKGEEIKLNKFNYDLVAQNIPAKIYDFFLDAYSGKDISEQALIEIAMLVVSNNPVVKIEDISFYKDDKLFRLNADLGVSGFDGKNIFALPQKAFLSGSVKFDKSFLDEIKVDKDAAKKLLDSGVVIEDGENFISNFKFDPNLMDVIMNDKVRLSELESHVLGVNQNADDAYMGANYLYTLVSDLSAFYTSQGKFDEKITNMTNLPLLEISHNKFALITSGMSCFEISTIDDANSTEIIVEVGADKHEEFCQEMYKDSEVSKLLEKPLKLR
ncbi:DUF945 family protein [Campylobacter geochelonis]|uniref:DUF945 family protein n=1 Tax=Campylobacter geochelonis TaxID=1780362 RepID=UPI000770A0C1|nr:DUF945 family protein [Campylobacter geochelonis]CZE51128.1 Uncharacterised protein [Campylobacter geochelonis]